MMPRRDRPTWANDFAVLALLAVISVAVRLPFWFRSVIDWDESTFILMGQELLDGGLPYVRLWENKPPLAFVPYALFVAIHPSIVAVRIGGAVCVALTAYVTYRIGTRLDKRKTGIIAGVLTVIFLSIIGSGQATMTETLAVVPLTGATVLLLSDRMTGRTAFTSGLLLGTAALIRMNLAYAALAGAVVLGVRLRHEGKIVSGIVAFGLGAAILPVVIALVYAWQGSFGALWMGAVRAPLSYSVSQDGAGTMVSAAVLAVLILAVALPLARRWPDLSATRRRQILVVAGLGVATGLSIVMTGPTYAHYRLQIVPFLAIPVALVLAGGLGRGVGLGAAVVVALLVATEGAPVFRQYRALTTSLARGEPLFNDRGYRVAAYLRAANPEREPMYLMSDHIAYWLTGTKPLTRVSTHPSNIGREYLLQAVNGPSSTTLSELQAILDQEPRFVATQKRVRYLEGQENAQRLLADRLAEAYDLDRTIGGTRIYRRRARPPR